MAVVGCNPFKLTQRRRRRRHQGEEAAEAQEAALAALAEGVEVAPKVFQPHLEGLLQLMMQQVRVLLCIALWMHVMY